MSVEKPTPRGVRGRKTTAFAENLRALTKSRGLSIRQVASVCECSTSVVQAWMNGGVPQDLLAIQKLCRAIHCDFEALLTGSSTKFDPRHVQLTDVFDEHDAWSGLYRIEAKKLVPKGQK